MTIPQQNKARLENDVTTRNNPNSISGIYFATAKVHWWLIIGDNRKRGKLNRK